MAEHFWNPNKHPSSRLGTLPFDKPGSVATDPPRTSIGSLVFCHVSLPSRLIPARKRMRDTFLTDMKGLRSTKRTKRAALTSQRRFDQDLVEWYNRSRLPYLLVESSAFRDMINGLNGAIDIPNRKKMRRMVRLFLLELPLSARLLLIGIADLLCIVDTLSFIAT